MNKNYYNKCGYCFTIQCDKTIGELDLPKAKPLNWRLALARHSSKAFQESLENEYQYMTDLRNANRDTNRLMFYQVLHGKQD